MWKRCSGQITSQRFKNTVKLWNQETTLNLLGGICQISDEVVVSKSRKADADALAKLLLKVSKRMTGRKEEIYCVEQGNNIESFGGIWQISDEF